MNFRYVTLRANNAGTDIIVDGVDYFVDEIDFANKVMSVTLAYDAFRLYNGMDDRKIICCDEVVFDSKETFYDDYCEYNQIDFYKNDEQVDQIVGGDEIVSCVRTDDGIRVKFIVTGVKEDEIREIIVDKIRFK